MKRNWALAVVLFFLPSFVHAQETLSGAAVSVETAANAPVPVFLEAATNAEVAPIAPSRLISRPEPERAANRKFWLTNAYHVLWTVADIETTAANLNSNTTCREMNPLVGSRPSRRTLYLSNLPVLVGGGYLSYRSRKHHGRLWYLLPAISGSAHAAGTIWNLTGSSC